MSATLAFPVLAPPIEVLAETGSHLGTEIIAGREQVLAMWGLLVELSHRSGQVGAMDHLEYFLSSEDSLRKRPYLVLVGEELGQPGPLIVGALLIHEYQVFGCGTGVFATDDTTGRRTLIAAPEARVEVEKAASRALMRSGAWLVALSVMEGLAIEGASAEGGACSAAAVSESAFGRDAEGLTGLNQWSGMERLIRAVVRAQPFAKRLQENGAPVRFGLGEWISAGRVREIPSYLPLESTMDATLAAIGQRTRSNLRYYRRRAEAQLGCSFVEGVAISRRAFQEFNRECAYAVTDDRAGSRYDALAKVPGMFLCGVRDGEGRWVSLLGGRRYHDMVEIDWQMNRNDLPAYSLSTVMRSYFIECEISRGTRKMFIEGGTPHAMRYSFATDLVRDVILLRYAWLLPLLRRAAMRFLPEKNFVLGLLIEEGLAWRCVLPDGPTARGAVTS